MIAPLLNNPKNHLLIFLAILLGCILLLIGRAYETAGTIGGDAVYYYANLRSIVIDHDLNLENEYEYFHNQRSSFTKNRKIPFIPDKNPLTGKSAPKYPIGSAIFLIPPFLLTHGILTVLHILVTDISVDGYHLIYQVSAAFGSLLYAFIGLLLIYNLGKKIFEPKIAFLATLGVWLATPLIYYMTMEPLTSQPISFFCVSLFLYLWYTTRKKRSFYQWLLLGIIGGLMSIVRYQDFLFLLIPIIDQIKHLRITTSGLLVFILSAGSVISIQLGINHYFYGSPFRAGIYETGLPYLISPKIFYTLFSLERGLLFWSPILIFAFIGLYWFTRKFPAIGILLLFSLLVQVYIVSSWADPTQGASFGNRILLNSSIIFALGIMQFLKNTRSYWKLFLTIFALLVGVNGILAGLFVLRFIGQPY